MKKAHSHSDPGPKRGSCRQIESVPDAVFDVLLKGLVEVGKLPFGIAVYRDLLNPHDERGGSVQFPQGPSTRVVLGSLSRQIRKQICVLNGLSWRKQVVGARPLTDRESHRS